MKWNNIPFVNLLPDVRVSCVQQYYDLAMEYLNEGIPLDGLGIQGHTKDYVKPDPTAMWVSTECTEMMTSGRPHGHVGEY